MKVTFEDLNVYTKISSLQKMPTILNKKYIYNNDMHKSLESDYLTEMANLLGLKLLEL